MVTERRGEYPHRDIREGGVAARFRPLAGVGDVLTGDPAACPPPSGASSPGAPPAFATAPWGYKRAEVDSWASWVAALLAHGRNETVRADSAEATLKATLQRLEQLQDRSPDGEQPVAPERTGVEALPRRVVPARGGPRPVPTPEPGPGASGPDTPPGPSAGDAASPTGRPADPASPADRPATPLPRPTGDDTGPDRPELARLQVVERTLHEVMALLHRLAGPDLTPERPREKDTAATE